MKMRSIILKLILVLFCLTISFLVLIKLFDNFAYKNKDLFLSEEHLAELPLENLTVPIEAFNFTVITNSILKNKERYSNISGQHQLQIQTIKIWTDTQRQVKSKAISDTNSVIFDITSHEDLLGRRLIDSRKKMNGTTAVVFFGGSNTYGVGVEDNETVPYYFSSYFKNTPVLNFARPGDTLGEIYNSLIVKKIPNFEIDHKKIIVIFEISNEQFNNLACSTNCLSLNKSDTLLKPRFILENEKIIKTGTHKEYIDQHPIIKKLLVNFKSITDGPFIFPETINKENIKLHYALLNAIRENLSESYEIIDFYQLYPLSSSGHFINSLESENHFGFKPIIIPALEVFQECNSWSYSFDPFTIPLNHNPTPAAHLTASQAIKFKINKDHPGLLK